MYDLEGSEDLQFEQFGVDPDKAIELGYGISFDLKASLTDIKRSLLVSKICQMLKEVKLRNFFIHILLRKNLVQSTLSKTCLIFNRRMSN